ncbi:DUF882 domain-containing protein [Enterovirga sp. CN4-39]|uniref:DUF882 domain-containing protein n=1 Tax=Enterovirga sp. CN4-39 TaxID=3400910 RepID=UPI003C046F69
MTKPQGSGREAARVSRAALGLAIGAAATLCGVQGTQDAVANGDTRAITIQHEHTKESATITFRRNGYYDQSGLNQLNWLLRDWRLDEPTRMEPKLFDIVWEVYREVGSREPIRVVSAYRSPKTNAMLRRRSRAVAEQSQHMAGRAMDFYLPDVSMSRVREIGMRLQNGGVGFYPNAHNPFVHLDAGSVRSWPRMTTDQLARLFPDGRTVHLPRDGKPLPGYELARADILARGGAVAGLAYAQAETGGERKSLWATLFGSFDDEDSDFYRSSASRTRAAPSQRSRVAYAEPVMGGNSDDAGTRGYGAAMTAAAAPEPAPVASRPQRAAPPPPEPAPVAQAVAAPLAVPPPVPPALPPDARPLSPEPITLASLAPTPPRRPEEVAPLLVAAPLPPLRPLAGPVVAGAAPVITGEMRGSVRPARLASVAAPGDERAALKALFDAAAIQSAPSKMQVSRAELDEVRPDRFRGPAVVSRPATR